MDDDVIARLGLIVTGEGSPEERAARAADLVRRVTGARWVGIYTVTGTVVACDGWSGPGAPAHPSFAVTEGLTAHAIRTGALGLSNDLSRDPRYLANQEDSGSELIVPILAADAWQARWTSRATAPARSAAPPSWITSDLPPPCAR
jgi:putative methionine-R-sulfoxide reductase with GAF domain